MQVGYEMRVTLLRVILKGSGSGGLELCRVELGREVCLLMVSVGLDVW